MLNKKDQVEQPNTDIVTENKAMSRVETMDSHLEFYGKNIDPSQIRRIIKEAFAIDLDSISLMGEGKVASTYPAVIMDGVRSVLSDRQSSMEDSYIMSLSKIEIMDLYLQSNGDELDGQEIRKIVNHIFGINLEGISGLEKARISLFSKGQWISQTPRDLIIVHTGKGDVDVRVYPTDFLKEKTGLTALPPKLENKLVSFGFTFNEELDALYYTNPISETVPDEFKGKTMGAIIEVITSEYPHL